MRNVNDRLADCKTSVNQDIKASIATTGTLEQMAFILITLVFIWELHMTSLVIICSLLQLLGAGTSYILRRKANLLHGSGKGNRGSINNGSIQGNIRPGGGNIDNRINNRNHLSGGGGGIEERAGLLNNNGNDFLNEDPSWIDSESREIH